MNEVTKQSLLDLLAAAKAHIEAGETAAAVEKIESAVATIENEGVDTADATPGGDTEGEGGEEGKPKDPPLPGQGTNGGRT
jgi:hypothetical protein